MKDVNGQVLLHSKGSRDKQTRKEMDMLQLIGNPCYKDKDSQESHRVYLNPSKYPFTDELSTI